jgi:hypothetical protein
MKASEQQVGGDHYQKKIQPLDIADEYSLSNRKLLALRYLLREKGNRIKQYEDLRKCIHCVQLEIEKNFSDCYVDENGVSKLKLNRYEVRRGEDSMWVVIDIDNEDNLWRYPTFKDAAIKAKELNNEEEK